jgi:hypothetical protein
MRVGKDSMHTGTVPVCARRFWACLRLRQGLRCFKLRRFVSQFKPYFTALVSFYAPPDCRFLRAQRMHAAVKMILQCAGISQRGKMTKRALGSYPCIKSSSPNIHHSRSIDLAIDNTHQVARSMPQYVAITYLSSTERARRSLSSSGCH